MLTAPPRSQKNQPLFEPDFRLPDPNLILSPDNAPRDEDFEDYDGSNREKCHFLLRDEDFHPQLSEVEYDADDPEQQVHIVGLLHPSGFDAEHPEAGAPEGGWNLLLLLPAAGWAQATPPQYPPLEKADSSEEARARAAAAAAAGDVVVAAAEDAEHDGVEEGEEWEDFVEVDVEEPPYEEDPDDVLAAVDATGFCDRSRTHAVVLRFPHAPAGWVADAMTSGDAGSPLVHTESWLMQVALPHLQTVLGASGKVFVAGYGQGGWSAVSLLFRHSDVVTAAASWGAPLLPLIPDPRIPGMMDTFREFVDYYPYQLADCLETSPYCAATLGSRSALEALNDPKQGHIQEMELAGVEAPGPEVCDAAEARPRIALWGGREMEATDDAQFLTQMLNSVGVPCVHGGDCNNLPGYGGGNAWLPRALEFFETGAGRRGVDAEAEWAAMWEEACAEAEVMRGMIAESEALKLAEEEAQAEAAAARTASVAAEAEAEAEAAAEAAEAARAASGGVDGDDDPLGDAALLDGFATGGGGDDDGTTGPGAAWAAAEEEEEDGAGDEERERRGGDSDGDADETDDDPSMDDEDDEAAQLAALDAEAAMEEAARSRPRAARGDGGASGADDEDQEFEQVFEAEEEEDAFR